MNASYREVITVEPGKRGGKPCIRGLRITVYDVLSYLATGMTHAAGPCRFSGVERGRHSGLSRVCRRQGRQTQLTSV